MAVPPTDSGKIEVLIVDDIPETRDNLKKLLLLEIRDWFKIVFDIKDDIKNLIKRDSSLGMISDIDVDR